MTYTDDPRWYVERARTMSPEDPTLEAGLGGDIIALWKTVQWLSDRVDRLTGEGEFPS